MPLYPGLHVAHSSVAVHADAQFSEHKTKFMKSFMNKLITFSQSKQMTLRATAEPLMAMPLAVRLHPISKVGFDEDDDVTVKV